MEPIAIIGYSIKLPEDGDTPEGFWRMMEEKRCAMKEWPEDRMNLEAFVHRDSKGFVPGAHFMKEDCGLFDASFFGISGTEACAMDPQCRLLLETAYRALENAGIPMEKINGTRTAVFNGCMTDDYQHILTHDPMFLPKYAAIGVTACMLANRLSWFFNLQGPSATLDSACSSSLMALDLACQSLRGNESDMAFVTGSNILLRVECVLSLMNMGFTSPDGRCFSFDDRANGYGRGEGVGVIVIKRLDDAIRDGNTIRAIIRSTGSNQDGYTPGVTQPSKEAQTRLILDTYRKAKLDLSVTRFFEAHGTGTAIGDPIEAESIGTVFRTLRTPEDPLYVGAVKSNIGHLEGASGLAGLVKAIMVLERGIIPPNANFERMNPAIDAEFFNIRVPTESIPWPAKGLRRASVASFGYGGSNTHAVLDDAYHYLKERGLSAAHCTVSEPQMHSQDTSTHSSLGFRIINEHGTYEGTRKFAPRIFVWSTEDEAGIQRMINEYTMFFQGLRIDNHEENQFLGRLATTLASNRSQLKWRAFAIGDSLDTLRGLKRVISRPVRISNTLGLGYIFTGQGAQYYQMGAELLGFPVFRASMELCQQAFDSFGCTWSMIDLLANPGGNFDINDPGYAQPLTTALQISLVDLLSSFGLEPRVVVGHSSGEIAAAYASGGLSLASACKVSYFRGVYASRLRKSNANGAMLAVNLSELAVEPYVSRVKSELDSNDLYIACINSPSNVTLSGGLDLVSRLKPLLDGDNIISHQLRTGVAYHSPHMLQAAAEYKLALEDLNAGQLTKSRPGKRVTMVSSVMGREIANTDCLSSPDYWVENLISPVKFSAAMAQVLLQSRKPKQNKRLGALAKHDICDWLEIGPHGTLKSSFREILQSCSGNKSRVQVRYLSTLDRNSPAIRSLQYAVGNLYITGYPVALDKINQAQPGASGYEHILVSLPQYPFNHTKQYWHEPRSSRNTRLCQQKKLELLGTPAPESTLVESKWRKIFDSSSSPWLLDHVVNGKALYPGTGMVVMAIEGAKQLADKRRPIAGYFLHDTTYLSPIAINTVSKTEAHLHMRAARNILDRASHSYEFQIYTEMAGKWQVNCRGQISIQYDTYQAESEAACEHLHSLGELAYYRRKWTDAQQDCTLPVTPDKIYKALEDNGLHYGPAFRVMEKMYWNGSSDAIGDIKLLPWTPEISQAAADPHVVHPATLDGLGQLGWVALTRGGEKAITGSFIASRVRRGWISASNPALSCPSTTSLKAYAHTRLKGLRGTETSGFALDSSSGQLKLWVMGMETIFMSSNSRFEEGERRRLCYSIDWKPDLETLSAMEVSTYCRGGRSEPDLDAGDYLRALNGLILRYARRTINSFTPEQPTGRKVFPQASHLKKYLTWLETQIVRASSDSDTSGIPSGSFKPTEEEDLGVLERHLAQRSSEAEVYITMGRNLNAILEGTVDPLQLLYGGNLAANHYQTVCSQMWERSGLHNYIGALGHKNPRMRILEVGAGTGSITGHLLEALTRHSEAGSHYTNSHNFLCYDYTDISGAFFEQAKERFSKFGPKVTYKTLDLEADAQGQGLENETYDLVVAAWVLHAVRDIGFALRNMRKLLRPGGKLLLLEIIAPDMLRNTFVYGTLPGWWIENEASSGSGPGLPEESWRALLQLNGFSDELDFACSDYDEEKSRAFSLMVATAASRVEDQPSRRVVFFVQPGSELQAQLVRLVIDRQDREKHDFEIHSIYDIDSMAMTGSQDQGQNPLLVFLPEVEQPILVDLDEAMFNALQRLLCRAQDVLWFTAASPSAIQSPQTHIIDGLARVLCTENNRLSFVTAHLEDHAENLDEWVKHIHYLLKHRLSSTGKATELDYREVDGVLHIGRLREAVELNDSVFEQTQAAPRLRPFRETNHPLMSVISRPGLLDTDSLVFTEDQQATTPLEPDQIEIEVKTVGTNFHDVFALLGKLNDGNSDAVGCECAGVVTRVGEGAIASSEFKPGDRVCAAILGCLRTLARGHAHLAVKIPDNLTFAMASAIPLAGITAYYALARLAHLCRAESILIHSGAGGTGQMAVQIAQALGAEVFVTVSTEEKKSLLQRLYNIPEDHIMQSRGVSFQRHIMRMTEGRGVDVVLNSLSGDGLIASWECIAPYGRFIELGKTDIEANSKLSMLNFARNVSFSAVAVDEMLVEKPTLVRELLNGVMRMVQDGTLTHPKPLQEFPVSAAIDAFKLMQGGKNMGKLVIGLGTTDLVRTSLHHTPSYSLPTAATYVIAGGLGGLGRSAARWMASMGAKNLILLSRSGPRSDAAQQLLSDLAEQGVRVIAPRCDVTSMDAVASVLRECSQSGWPSIRGCIQGTMVLQDSIFETLTFQQWTTTLRSKVQSTQNLHALLPPDLDFFIILSSLAGIAGTVSQANYAAGNTFQDAFAAYQRAIGQHAVSLDLGYMAEVGIMAEEEKYAARARQTGISALAQIHEAEFHALLENYCRPPGPEHEQEHAVPDQAQTLVGLVTAAQLRANGITPPAWLEERALFYPLQLASYSASDSLNGANSALSSDSPVSIASERDWYKAFTQALTDSDPVSAATTVVVDGITQRLSRALTVGVGDIDPLHSLALQGVDSLVAVELRHWISRAFAADVSALDIMSALSLEHLAGIVVAQAQAQAQANAGF
ncbi:hypothetical protein BDW71DRAFT_212203 [Aspergillus fruticulosus]